MLNPDSVTQLCSAASQRLELGISKEALGSIHQYVSLLIPWSQRINLFSRKFDNLDLAKLIVSSLVFVKYVDLAGKRLLDVGSGAGLPGLVTELAFPKKLTSITLTEPRRWRRLFLEDAIIKLKLAPRMKVLADRAENVEGQFDLVTARAVGSAKELLPALEGKLAEAGIIVLFGYEEIIEGWQQEYHEVALPHPMKGIQGVRVIRKGNTPGK